MTSAPVGLPIFHLETLPVAQKIWCLMVWRQRIAKVAEGRAPGLIWTTIPAFVWRDWEHWINSGYSVSRPRFESETQGPGRDRWRITCTDIILKFFFFTSSLKYNENNADCCTLVSCVVWFLQPERSQDVSLQEVRNRWTANYCMVGPWGISLSLSTAENIQCRIRWVK
jgi:hypothetical protein